MADCITTLDFLRHGEPVGGERIRGQLDDPLSELGWVQMRRAVEGYSSCQQVISSPLKRCAEFAGAFAQAQALACVEDERLKEIGFGEWEGRSKEDIDREHAGRRQSFKQNPCAWRPQGSESVTVFYDRIQHSLAEWVTHYRGQQLLVVAHAGVIRMAICWALKINVEHAFKIKTRYAGATRIEVHSSGGEDHLFLTFHDRMRL